MQERSDPVNSFLDPTTGMVKFRTILLLNNMMYRDPITEKPTLGNTEEWVFINTTPDVHPMHVHLVKFEVIEKGYIDTVNFPEAYTRADGTTLPRVEAEEAFIPNAEPGDPANTAPEGSLYAVAANEKKVWKDTVFVPPAGQPFDAMTNVANPGYVKIRATFGRPGTYMWHCHILSHEENEMMRRFMVVPTGN
jgi:spore coat protein A